MTKDALIKDEVIKKDESVEKTKNINSEANKQKDEVEDKTDVQEEKKVRDKVTNKEGKKKTIKDIEPEEAKEIQVPAKFKKLVEEIEKMTVLDLSELVKILEKKLGVTAVAPISVATTATPSTATGAETEKEEKSVFNIELKEIGAQKIEVIKAVRDITERGLKEAKDLVDAVANEPQILKENVKKEEAEEVKKKIEAAGGKVELK